MAAYLNRPALLAHVRAALRAGPIGFLRATAALGVCGETFDCRF